MIYEGFFDGVSPSLMASIISAYCLERSYGNTQTVTDELLEVQKKLTVCHFLTGLKE